MNWQEFKQAKPKLPDNPTEAQWREAVAEAQRMIDTEVVEADRQMARTILGDTLIQWGAFWGFTLG